MTVDAKPGTDGTPLVRRWLQERPLVSFFVLAISLSWVCWLLSFLTGSGVFFFLGGLGPAAAAAIVAREQGTLQDWWARVVRWRVSPWFYLFAFGAPVVLYMLPNLLAVATGDALDWSLTVERLPAYAGTWVAALLMGGLEEPGWRGFALPRLQERFSPVQATLVLGLLWGLWHVPVIPLNVVVAVPLAFVYTWLYNRTRSALLCILLHASVTPAQEHLLLVPDTAAVELTIGVGLIAAAVGTVVLTRGRLGLPADDRAAARA